MMVPDGAAATPVAAPMATARTATARPASTDRSLPIPKPQEREPPYHRITGWRRGDRADDADHRRCYGPCRPCHRPVRMQPVSPRTRMGALFRHRGKFGPCIVALAALAGTLPAQAQDYFKGKTIRLVVGTPPGGGYDT